MQEIAERYKDCEVTLARRRFGGLRQLSLQRAPVEHRAPAAAQPRGLHREELEARTQEVLALIRS